MLLSVKLRLHLSRKAEPHCRGPREAARDTGRARMRSVVRMPTPTCTASMHIAIDRCGNEHHR